MNLQPWEVHLAAFEESWRDAREADFAWEPDIRLWLAKLAPSGDQRQTLLTELALIDAEFRFRWGRPPWRVEALLKRLPELRESHAAASKVRDTTPMLELVLQEYRLALSHPTGLRGPRPVGGEVVGRPSRSDFIARFPSLLGLGEWLGMVESEVLIERAETAAGGAVPMIAPLTHHDFRLRKMLGAGGAARVYVATQKSIDKVVAVKIQNPGWINDREATQRMLTEAHMAARVRHPHVASVHGIGRLPSGALFLVMDFIPGNSLSEEIDAAERTLPTDAVDQLATQLRQVVNDIHRQGVLHGDISPANLIVDRTRGAPRLVLTDFGHAVEEHPGVVSASIGRGTAPFAAPELVEHGVISRETDLYSVEQVIQWMRDGGSLRCSTG